MYIKEGDEVILINTEEPNLRHYIGLKWKVKTIIYACLPASAIITRNNLQASCFIRQLEVVPPESSPFNYDDLVSIKKTPDKKITWTGSHYPCHDDLLGKIGKIKGYDSRNEFLLVRCTSGGSGWFSPQCLIPLDYKGERFFYPQEEVTYKDKTHTISKIKKSKFKWGQLLFIEGEWVPSTDVEPLT